jgi:hypothetical protein
MNNLTHIECIFDFCGKESSPGFWADTFADESGNKFISFGGDWISYTNKFKSIRKDFGDKYIEEVISGKRTGKDWLGEELEKAWNKIDYPAYFPFDEKIAKDLENDCYSSALALIEENLIEA